MNWTHFPCSIPTFFFRWLILIVRTNCRLHLAYNIFWKTNGILDSQSQEGCHQLFAELPVELEIGQILLVHFVMEGSGIGSHCIEEEEVGIQCPSLRSSSGLSIHASCRTLLPEPTQSLFQSSHLHRKSGPFCHCRTISLILIHIQDHPSEQLLSFPLVIPSKWTSGFR